MRFLCDKKRKDDTKYTIRSVERIFEFEERNNENGENTSEATVLLHSRHDYSSSTTVSFFLSPPPFLFFFSILHRYALPQQPSSLWGTHYRCFFHVISKPHTPFRATLHTRRLSICGPTWIVYFLSFFALFVFFFFFVFSTPLILFPFVSQRVETSLAYFESLISDRIFIRIFTETYIPYKIHDINYKFYSYRISIRIHIHSILALFQIVRLKKLFDKRARIFLVPLSSCIFLFSSDRLVFICTSAE